MKITSDGFARILSAEADIVGQCSAFGRALNDPAQRHTLPAHFQAIEQMRLVFISALQAYAPEVLLAVERGLKSTDDLHPSELQALESAP